MENEKLIEMKRLFLEFQIDYLKIEARSHEKILKDLDSEITFLFHELEKLPKRKEPSKSAERPPKEEHHYNILSYVFKKWKHCVSN